MGKKLNVCQEAQMFCALASNIRDGYYGDQAIEDLNWFMEQEVAENRYLLR